MFPVTGWILLWLLACSGTSVTRRLRLAVSSNPLAESEAMPVHATCSAGAQEVAVALLRVGDADRGLREPAHEGAAGEGLG